MPYKRSTRRRVSKRRPRRYRRRATIKKSLPLTGFPKQKVVKLRYVQEILLNTPGGGVSKSIPFVANGCFDPYYPIGGHQPKGFDQWMTLYSHYNVLGSKCSVRLFQTATQDFTWGVARTPTPNELDNKTLEYILECRMNKGFSISGSFAVNNNMPTSTVRTIKYSQKKQHGMNSTSKSELVGSASSNPAELTIFEVWCAPSAIDMESKVVKFIVTIDYIVLFTEQKVLDQS